MPASLPDRATVAGYKCTNKECLRIFDTMGAFDRHRFHREQKGTRCAHPKNGAIVYQVPVSGVGLRHTRIVLQNMFPGKGWLYCAWFKYACVIVYACSSHTDSESDSEDSSVPDAGNLGDSNGGGHIDPDVEEPGDEREDDDEGGSEDFPDFPEEEGRYHTMAEHLAKLDGLAVRGCADKFFSAYSARWGSSMPRPGDVLHSARHGGEDARASRKRKADGIHRSLAETHAFITSSNASEARGDGVIETFCNVRSFEPIARYQSN